MPARRIALSLSLVAAPLAIGPVGSASAQEAGTLAETRDQGVLYCKKKRFKQALRYLNQAYAMKGGPGDFPTVYYRGVAAFALGQIELAHEMVEIAERLAVDERRKRRVLDLSQQIRELYGPVVFEPTAEETSTRGRIFLEAKTGIINRDKRERFDRLRERYRTTALTLPKTLFLPYGEYTANGIPFAVVERAEKPPTVEIFLQPPEDEGGVIDSIDGTTWMWIGIGTAAAVGIGVGAALLFGGEDEGPVGRQDVPFFGEQR